MAAIRAFIMMFAVLFIIGDGLAQERGGRGERGAREGRGERGERRERKAEPSGKQVVDVEAVISEVGEASISYQIQSGEKVQTKMIGVADVTRVEKVQWQPVKVKDLHPGDKAVITIYQDPEDPYFPALSVRVIGKGEVKKVARGRD